MVGNLESTTVAKARVEASQWWLADLIEQAEDCIAFLDMGGRLTEFNRAAERLTGRRKEDLLGIHFADSLCFAPESLSSVAREVERVAVGEERPAFELIILSALGDRRTLECKARLIRREGRAIGIACTGRDITERRVAEVQQEQLRAALQKSAMEWRLTFDAMKSPILMLDLTGRVLRVNQAAQQLCGRPYLEMVDQSVDVLGAGAPWGKMAALVRSLREKPSAEPVQALNEGGGQTWEIEASLIAPPPETAEGRVLIMARDITSLVKLQESLRRSETLSAMGSLVAGVAHEVRNPLFGMSATLDAAERRLGKQAAFQTYGSVLRGELNRLTGLMQELLDYGRPRALNTSRVSVEPAIDRAITACRALAESSKVNVVWEPGGRPCQVDIDTDRIAQVFQNLIENSIQHSRAGGTVAVATRNRREGGRCWIECTVEDSGPGFNPADLPRIFEPFFSRRRGGTGLGLSIVQRIVEQHGGQIAAARGAKGGALMVVRLPASAGSSPGEP